MSLTYASDWGTQNLGAFLDDVTLPDGTSTSFESGLEGWTVSGAPAGSAANGNDWVVTDAGGFPVGAAISTPDSVLLGFGFEGIATPAERDEVMERALEPCWSERRGWSGGVETRSLGSRSGARGPWSGSIPPI